MSEKSNLYVNKVISNQLGHNSELTMTPFKNTVCCSDNLFEELGATDDDIKEIAIRIDNDLNSNFYNKIIESETVSDIQKIVAEAQIEDGKFDDLLQAFEPPKKEAAAHAAAIPVRI